MSEVAIHFFRLTLFVYFHRRDHLEVTTERLDCILYYYKATRTATAHPTRKCFTSREVVPTGILEYSHQQALGNAIHNPRRGTFQRTYIFSYLVLKLGETLPSGTIQQVPFVSQLHAPTSQVASFTYNTRENR